MYKTFSVLKTGWPLPGHIFFLSVSFNFAFAASSWFSNMVEKGRHYQLENLK